MCDTVEKPNIRFTLVCIIAAKLPTSSDSAASAANSNCQSPLFNTKPLTRMRKAKRVAAILGTEPINAPTEVGAP